MPDIRYALKHGDKTSTNGVLMAGHGTSMTHHGTPVAREGDIATCPACNSEGPVYNDCHPSFDIRGKQILVSGARVHCKCQNPPLVIHSQTNFTIEVNRRGGHAPDVRQSQSPTENARAAADFNERFRILDSTTKQPIANVDYAIKRAGGKLEYGTTDASGYTHLLTSTTRMESVEIFIEGEA